MRPLPLTCLVVAAALAAPATTAFAAGDLTIDTITNAASGFSTTPLSNRDFHDGVRVKPSVRAVGQVVTAPEHATALTRVDFHVWAWSEPGLRAEVWGWDGEKPTTQLHHGVRRELDQEQQDPSWTFAPIAVAPGEQYVLVLSAFDATDPSSGFGRASWTNVGDNGPWDDRYTGGEFVLFPGADRTTFTSTAWQTFGSAADYDLAFRAVFAIGDPPAEPDPEPETPPPGGGGGGIVAGPGPVTVETPSAEAPAPLPPAVEPGPVGAAPGATPAAPARPVGATRCIVPDLRRKTVENARRALARAHCRLGRVQGRGPRVLRQGQPGGRSLPTDSAVSVVVFHPAAD